MFFTTFFRIFFRNEIEYDLSHKKGPKSMISSMNS